MPLPGAQVLISSRLSGLRRYPHIDKARFGKPGLGFAPPVAAPATQPHSRAGSACSFGRQRRLVDHIRDRQPAARLQHAKRLAEHLRLVRHQIDHAVREDHVGGVVGDRQMLELAKAELDIARRRSWLRFRALSSASRASCRRRSHGPSRRPGRRRESSRSRRRCRDRSRSRRASTPQSLAGCRSQGRDWLRLARRPARPPNSPSLGIWP